MSETGGFDDTGGLLFISLIGLSAAIGVTLTEIIGIDGPGALPLVVSLIVGVPMFISVVWFCVIFNPFGARELLVGKDND